MGCTSSRQAREMATAAGGGMQAIGPVASSKSGDLTKAPALARVPSRKLARMSEDTAKKWLVMKAKKQGGAKARFILLGWAGSSSNAFSTWALKDTELIAAELPARNARLQETGVTDVNMIAKRIAEAMDVMGYLRSKIPLVLLGHSFGAMVSVSIARVLKKEYDYVPRLLVVAGCRPLHLWGFPMNYYRENNDDMIQSMVDCGGLTKEMAKDKTLMGMVLPAIKADHLAMDKYVLDTDAPPLDAPILYLGGDEDPRAPADLAAQWQQYTTQPLQIREFRGSHFFIKDNQAEVLNYLNTIIPTLSTTA